MIFCSSSAVKTWCFTHLLKSSVNTFLYEKILISRWLFFAVNQTRLKQHSLHTFIYIFQFLWTETENGSELHRPTSTPKTKLKTNVCCKIALFCVFSVCAVSDFFMVSVEQYLQTNPVKLDGTRGSFPKSTFVFFTLKWLYFYFLRRWFPSEPANLRINIETLQNGISPGTQS